jgi:hypothetical protein
MWAGADNDGLWEGGEIAVRVHVSHRLSHSRARRLTGSEHRPELSALVVLSI